MGTNYYYRDGRHIAKTSAYAEGRFQVFWAIQPDDLDRLDILDEYGRELTPAQFMAIVLHAAHWERSTIGEEFS